MDASEARARWASQRRPRASQACETCRARKTKVRRRSPWRCLSVPSFVVLSLSECNLTIFISAIKPNPALIVHVYAPSSSSNKKVVDQGQTIHLIVYFALLMDPGPLLIQINESEMLKSLSKGWDLFHAHFRAVRIRRKVKITPAGLPHGLVYTRTRQPIIRMRRKGVRQ